MILEVETSISLGIGKVTTILALETLSDVKLISKVCYPM